MNEFHIALTGRHPGTTIWIHSGMALGADTVWGFAATRSKKQRVRRHANLVKINKIARKHQRNFKPRRQKTPTLIITPLKAEPINTPF